MIDVWIRVFAVADESPCWRQLVEAVAASHGGQNPALAKTLAQDLEIATGITHRKILGCGRMR